MHQITFDEELHRYTVDGRQVPGISEILRACGVTSPPHPRALAKMGKGRTVHSYLELANRGEIGAYTVDPAAQGYLDQWARFLLEMCSVVYRDDAGLYVERTVYCEEGDYCTRIDVVLACGPEAVLVNIKTGSPMAHYGIQLAAERMACPIPCPHVVDVYLNGKSRRAKVRPGGTPADLARWREVLEQYSSLKEDAHVGHI